MIELLLHSIPIRLRTAEQTQRLQLAQPCSLSLTKNGNKLLLIMHINAASSYHTYSVQLLSFPCLCFLWFSLYFNLRKAIFHPCTANNVSWKSSGKKNLQLLLPFRHQTTKTPCLFEIKRRKNSTVNVLLTANDKKPYD